MIFTYVVILLETRKNSKFEGLKINIVHDMAILRFLKNENFAKSYRSCNFEGFSEVHEDHIMFFHILIVHHEYY